MGHVRLGYIAKTRIFQEVVGLVSVGAGVADVAKATMEAAERGLAHVHTDRAVVETIWMLHQIPMAARTNDPVAALRALGLRISDRVDAVELAAEVNAAIDRAVVSGRRLSDVGEMAQASASETLVSMLCARATTLDGVTHESTIQALRGMDTVKEFGLMMKQFFGRFGHKFLDYFLSRTYADHIGHDRRWQNLAQQAEFERDLLRHTTESAEIVNRFSGQWHAKTKWQQGEINRMRASRYTYVAMKKLRSEITMQRTGQQEQGHAGTV